MPSRAALPHKSSVYQYGTEPRHTDEANTQLKFSDSVIMTSGMMPSAPAPRTRTRRPTGTNWQLQSIDTARQGLILGPVAGPVCGSWRPPTAASWTDPSFGRARRQLPVTSGPDGGPWLVTTGASGSLPSTGFGRARCCKWVCPGP